MPGAFPSSNMYGFVLYPAKGGVLKSLGGMMRNVGPDGAVAAKPSVTMADVVKQVNSAEDSLVMETKLKIIEILQVNVHM